MMRQGETLPARGRSQLSSVVLALLEKSRPSCILDLVSLGELVHAFV